MMMIWLFCSPSNVEYQCYRDVGADWKEDAKVNEIHLLFVVRGQNPMELDELKNGVKNKI